MLRTLRTLPLAIRFVVVFLKKKNPEISLVVASGVGPLTRSAFNVFHKSAYPGLAGVSLVTP